MLDLADEFELNPLGVKGWRRVGEAGSTADGLIQLMKKSGFRNSEIASRMQPYARRILNAIPGEKLKRLIPLMGYALTATTIIRVVTAPAEALASELGVSEQTAQLILDGQVVIRLSDIWNPGQEVDTAELADGSIFSVGDYMYVWKSEPLLGPPFARVVWSKHVRILEIRLTETPGKVSVLLDDGTAAGMRMSTDGTDIPSQAVIERAVSYE